MGGIYREGGGWKKYLFIYFIVEESVKIFKVVDNETWDIKWERSTEVLEMALFRKECKKGF